MLEKYRLESLRKQAECKEVKTKDLDEILLILNDGYKSGENFYIEYNGTKLYSVDATSDLTSALRQMAILNARKEDPLYEPTKPLGWEIEDARIEHTPTSFSAGLYQKLMNNVTHSKSENETTETPDISGPKNNEER